MVKEDMARGYGHRTLAADYTMKAAARLGEKDGVREQSLTSVSRHVRRQATKRAEKADRAGRVPAGERRRQGGAEEGVDEPAAESAGEGPA